MLGSLAGGRWAPRRRDEREDPLATKTVFISFDTENDEDLKSLLVGQAKNFDSPFRVADWSLKQPLTGNGKERVRPRIGAVDLVVVICGQQTDAADGVSAELTIAQEESIVYFLLWGRHEKTCVKPKAAKSGDKIYGWTWDDLKQLIEGAR